MPADEFEKKFGDGLRSFAAAIEANNDGPAVTQLRADLEFSRMQGPNYMVMTTQETVIAVLARIDALAKSK